jgi:arylsulfatase A-like enzyme
MMGKNVVLIVLDTQRVDRLGVYGYSRPLTPNIDQFSQKSVVFEYAVAPAHWTLPSHASIFTGEMPSVHTTNAITSQLPESLKTIAEILSQNGFNTFGYSNNIYVGGLDNGMYRGFNEFRSYNGIKSGRQDVDDPKKSDTLLFHIATKGITELAIRDAMERLKFIKQNKSTNNFIFINLMEAHYPYFPPRAFLNSFAPECVDNPDFVGIKPNEQFDQIIFDQIVREDYEQVDRKIRALSNIYDAEVAYQDSLLGLLFEFLESPFFKESTLAFILADHGEMLGEHGVSGHNFGIFEELLHVPLIMRAPCLKAQRVNQKVSIVDVFYTILDFLGIREIYKPYSHSFDLKSRSLISQVQSQEGFLQYVYCESLQQKNNPNHAYWKRKYPKLFKNQPRDKSHWVVYHADKKFVRIEPNEEVLYQFPLVDIKKHRISKPSLMEKYSQILDDLVFDSKRKLVYIEKLMDIKLDQIVQKRLRDLGYF